MLNFKKYFFKFYHEILIPGVPHLSSTTQINIIQLPLAGVTTIMLLVPGENPDREKTIKTLETITGGKITIKDIRPYTLENLPKDYGNNLPTPDGKKYENFSQFNLSVYRNEIFFNLQEYRSSASGAKKSRRIFCGH